MWEKANFPSKISHYLTNIRLFCFVVSYKLRYYRIATETQLCTNRIHYGIAMSMLTLCRYDGRVYAVMNLLVSYSLYTIVNEDKKLEFRSWA